MGSFLSSLVWRGVSEFILSDSNIDHFRGKKAVVAIMALDRNHTEFKKAEAAFARLNDAEELILVAEDHPAGALHERFHVKPGDFCFVLVDKEGNELMRSDHAQTLETVRRKLEQTHG